MIYVQWAWFSELQLEVRSFIVSFCRAWFWAGLVGFVMVSHLEGRRELWRVPYCTPQDQKETPQLCVQFLFLEVHSLVCLILSTRFQGWESCIKEVIFVLQIYEHCCSKETTEAIALGLGLHVAGVLSHCPSEMPRKFGVFRCSMGIGSNCLTQISYCKNTRVGSRFQGFTPLSVSPPARPDIATVHHWQYHQLFLRMCGWAQL